ncbi:MAG: hypothetical protein E7773_03930 [Sphingomonas sp.]|uniref:lysozyme inhibitor LprI family protein n=1 Tax=Sphingomonas sp. TaxID=28214 RepID=UPI00121E5B7C|nr:lysozyme inhibitor LprI family protein [Sphingomonas sp.]THD37196.1 MAG: hypothetical protein E7773_03930 [Sphingomonas sp.]
MIGLLAMAAASGPSFDCARARTKIERAICADAELALLDREEARLYRLALAGPAQDRNGLIARQRQFLRDRDQCVEEETTDTVPQCVRDAYLGDIADLRRLAGFGGDAGGISSGPIQFTCDGGFPDAFVTTFKLTPAQAYISMPSTHEGQPLVATPGSARLTGRYDTGMTYDGGDRLQIDARICVAKR